MDKVIRHKIVKHTNEDVSELDDLISVEEPLEIRIDYLTQQGVYKVISLAVTMRTPGDDVALAKGFLFTEGVIQDFSEIISVEEVETNIIVLKLSEEARFDAESLQRNFYTSSSCGVCGKASIESIHSETIYLPWSSKFTFSKQQLFTIPKLLLKGQNDFSKTGGIHACCLINGGGALVAIKEDVGRHNAMDKLIGNIPTFPSSDVLVLVSGRASFELVQKASKAGIPLLAAIGAPSSLAIQLAEEQGMTLVGFLKDGSFNVYSCPERIV